MTPPSLDDARQLLDAGRLDEAQATCLALLARDPANADAWHLSARIEMRRRNFDDAACQIISALSLRNDPAFIATQREIDAAMLCEQAQLLKKQLRFTPAIATAHRATEILPDHAAPLITLGDLEMLCGRADSAIDLLRRAAYAAPPSLSAHSHLLFAMAHSDRVTPRELFNEHLEWARRYTPTTAAVRPIVDPPDPARPIRVGYVSPDFRNHPVAVFIEPVLAAHDRANFEITVYNDTASADEVTARLRALGHRWVDSHSLGYEELFRRIGDDRIDILIDLAVHTNRNRLPLFAAKAAPIQMTWLGYAGTTGCAAVDYRITDATMDPPGAGDEFFTEQLLRLPEIFWCYRPPDSAPPIESRPPGPIRIGTATRLGKISPTCLELWCRLLAKVPQARLVLAAEPFADDSVRNEWLAKITSHGVPTDRVELQPARDIGGYMAFLGTLDIALDTFPFNGGTTLCHALWMGAPAVALRGDSSVARVSASILRCIGCADLIAESAEQWIEMNARLASDSTRRSELRQGLRDRIRNSALGDAAWFTRQLEEAFRKVFESAIRRQMSPT